MQNLLTKLQDIINNPSQLFLFVTFFGIAILILNFLARTVGFILRLIIAAAIILTLVYFFF